MSLPEQSTNKSNDKQMELHLTMEVPDDMTPNIFVPIVLKALTNLGAIKICGTIKNIVEQDNEVNKVTIFNRE